MFQVTLFGGHEGRLRNDKVFYLTMFGACELNRPTIARQLVDQQRGQESRRPPRPRPFFLTVFGAAEIKSPTLAEEFLDLREMINGGLLTMAAWERGLLELGRNDGAVASFTAFGAFDECGLPTEDEEIESLATHRHLGNVTASAGEVLQYGIGQKGAERTATIRRAVSALA